jgi:hypothetical protein
MIVAYILLGILILVLIIVTIVFAVKDSKKNIKNLNDARWFQFLAILAPVAVFLGFILVILDKNSSEVKAVIVECNNARDRINRQISKELLSNTDYLWVLADQLNGGNSQIPEDASETDVKKYKIYNTMAAESIIDAVESGYQSLYSAIVPNMYMYPSDKKMIEEERKGWGIYFKRILKSPIVNDRWNAVKPEYSPMFRDYVDTLIK